MESAEPTLRHGHRTCVPVQEQRFRLDYLPSTGERGEYICSECIRSGVTLPNEAIGMKPSDQTIIPGMEHSPQPAAGGSWYRRIDDDAGASHAVEAW